MLGRRTPAVTGRSEVARVGVETGLSGAQSRVGRFTLLDQVSVLLLLLLLAVLVSAARHFIKTYYLLLTANSITI